MRALELAGRVLTEVANPLDGVTPSMSVFGMEFAGRVSIILGGLWALVLAAGAAGILVGGGKWAWASKVSHSSEGVMEAAGQFKTALVAFAAIAGASVVIGAVLWLVQG